MPHEELVSIGEQTVSWSWEVPPGCRVIPHPVPNLLYPLDVAATINWDMPPTIPETVQDEDQASWPRIDLIPEDGIIVWLCVGDLARDYTVEPPPGRPMTLGGRAIPFLRPVDGPGSRSTQAGATVPQLDPEDRTVSRWPTTQQWNRLIPLIGSGGEASDTPLYARLRVIVGPMK